MGSGRDSASSGVARCLAAVGFVVVACVGCTSDSEPEPSTVTLENAYSAIVRWEVERSEPVVDDEGNVEAPVIYLAAGSGGTVDVGVQASVVSSIDDAAVIRFADNARDARDESLEDEPIRDDGVMILIDEFELGRANVEARIVRYQSIDDDHAWILELVALGGADDGAEVESATLANE